MAEAHGLRKPDQVVRPITAAGGRTCARPGCSALARATLTFAYEHRRARLVGLLPDPDPAAYDLCPDHANRTSPPFGWTISDDRPPEPDGEPVNLADEDRTVAVISAALRAVPEAADEPDVPEAPRALDTPDAPRAPDAANAPDALAPAAAEPGEDARALADAATALAGAEVEVALDELADLDALDPPAGHVEPDVWRAEVAPRQASTALTLPFEDGARDPDEFDADATLSPDGHAQVW